MILIIGYGMILVGFIAIFSGIIGLFRFPDFYTKIHAASVIECCGVPLSLSGLAFLQNNFVNSSKLLFAAMLILVLNPVSTTAVAKAALLSKEKIYKLKQKYK